MVTVQRGSMLLQGLRLCSVVSTRAKEGLGRLQDCDVATGPVLNGVQSSQRQNYIVEHLAS